MPRLATYNVHDCIGRDGRYAPRRIAEIIAALDADIVALQEVTVDHAGDIVRLLEETTGMHAINGALFERGVGRYGNLLLSRMRPISRVLHDISHAGREVRGVIDAAFDIDGRHWRILATHLGLEADERRVQLGLVAGLAAQGCAEITSIMGDFNVWSGLSAFRKLSRQGFDISRVRSFPTFPMPILNLDRILLRGKISGSTFSWFDGKCAAIASDHFPVLADVQVLP